MPKRHYNRKAFTLIEVMVAVMIVSVVIAALLQMQGNTSHKFMKLRKIVKESQYSSFLISVGDKYGYESSNSDMYRLADTFDMESDLRRKLKSLKTKITYDELQVLDSSDFEDDVVDGENSESTATGLIFEIGKTHLEGENFSLSLIRVKIQ